MRLTAEVIQEFKTLYKEEFGEDLSDGETEQRALELLRLFMILAETPPDDSHHLPACRCFDRPPAEAYDEDMT
jgi:hypothetical protein